MMVMTPVQEVLAVMRWWLVLVLLGTAVTPLSFHLLKRLPDRGYAFVKMLGLLLVSYIFWLAGSVSFLSNDLGGILTAVLIVLAFSAWAWHQQRGEIGPWLRRHWRYLLLAELLFLAVYLFWVWVRAQNPAIVATEKPMDFAFLNAIGRSDTFPPLDPWLSGFAISYYYFGYLMMGMLAQLTAVPEPYAFNLAIAWLTAATAVGAFGLVYNLIAAYGGKARRAALALGLVAAIALPIAGNLEIVLEALHGQGIGSAGFWAWLDVRDLTGPPDPATPPRYENSFWWWWRASRPINEYSLAGGRIEGLEPIVEFPAFSFVLGDMHPHVMALPFAFLSLGIALAWFWPAADPRRRSLLEPRFWTETGFFDRFPLLVQEVGVPFWLLTAVVLGGLSFLNTWDVLIHLFVVLGAFGLAQWRRYGWSRQILGKLAVLALVLAIPVILLYLPFYLGFRSQAGPPFLLPMLNQPTRLVQFLIVFGLPLGTITVLLLVLGVKQRFRHWKTGLGTAVGLLVGLLLLALLLAWVVAASAEGGARVVNLAAELNLALPSRPGNSIAPLWAVRAVGTILPAYLGARLALPGMTLLLAGIIALAVMIAVEKVWPRAAEQTNEPAPERETPLPFVLLLIFTGALLTLGPEFVYLRDNFGMRLNTIFKFYYQAWVLFGTAAIFGLYYLWRTLSGAQKVVPALVTAGYGLLLLLSLLFPYYAIQSRAEEFRGPAGAEFRQPLTLNGLAAMQQFSPDEYAAILWLREQVEGTPVILEAVGGQYSPYGRVSASTGLPTLLGWAGHQYQWRGSDALEPGLRDPVVRDIYTAPGWENSNAGLLLDEYGVEYIFVGPLEQNSYGPDTGNFEKFHERLEIAYQNGAVTIYKWLPQQ